LIAISQLTKAARLKEFTELVALKTHKVESDSALCWLAGSDLLALGKNTVIGVLDVLTTEDFGDSRLSIRDTSGPIEPLRLKPNRIGKIVEVIRVRPEPGSAHLKLSSLSICRI
jgi:hypothetical protein